MKFKGIGRTLLLLLASAQAVGCAPKAPPKAPRPSVTVARVKLQDVPRQLEATGTVEPWQTVAVTSQVGGILRSVGFKEGSEVAAGQVLFRLDSRPFEAALEQARAALARDAALAETARQDGERARALHERGLISDSEFQAKHAAAATTAASVRSDSAAVFTARLNLEYATIRSPLGGRTGRLLLQPGNLVKAVDTGNPLVVIDQIRPIRVRFALSQQDLPRVLVDRTKPLTVRVHPRGEGSLGASGMLSFVDNAVDPATGTILLKGDFPNHENLLWPGEFVDAELVLSVQKGACVVPAMAVTTGPAGSFVYVVGPDSTAASRPVTVDRLADDTAIIRTGLREGELVITDGQARVSPGARVLIRTPARPASASRP